MAGRKTNNAQATFTNCLRGVIEEADALARQENVELALWLESPAGQPYVYKTPGFNTVSRRYRNASQARIRQNQATLDRITKELAEEKERAKVLKKREEELFKKHEVKEIADMNLEELLAFKEKLEILRETINSATK
ncbi:unnamed protein product [Microthlaspi erraticum]|uniref:MADS-box domain-containing protein n=1 Tax=Microthlaspi erraticum TaxID=1685480 RepID=A0A6D2JX43_9BRAS|nr:unnamed protein product [Microthlaspi erraticum]